MFRVFNLPESPFEKPANSVAYRLRRSSPYPYRSWVASLECGDEFAIIAQDANEVDEVLHTWNQALAKFGHKVDWEEPEERIHLAGRPNLSGQYPTFKGYWLHGWVLATRKEFTGEQNVTTR